MGSYSWLAAYLCNPGSAIGDRNVPVGNNWGAELQVGADQEVALVSPGEALAMFL